MTTEAFLVVQTTDGKNLVGQQASSILDPFRNKTYTGLIPVTSWELDVDNAVTTSSGGGGAGKVAISALHVSRPSDPSSPALFLDVCKGTRLLAVDLLVRRTSTSSGSSPAKVFYGIALDTVTVSSTHLLGGTADQMENLSFYASKYSVGYAPMKGDGSLGTFSVTSWDVTKSTGG